MSKILAYILTGSLLPMAALAQESGEQVFRRHCSACHAPGMNHPGTIQLTLTRGAENGVLEQRSNLAADYVRTIVRQGLNAMPAFKPTHVSDEDLEAVARYLAK